MKYWEKKTALESQCFLLSKFFCVNIFRIFSAVVRRNRLPYWRKKPAVA